MERIELMQKLWVLAEKAQVVDDYRQAYLLTLAGNLVEETYTTGDVFQAVVNATDNAHECCAGMTIPD